MKPEFVITKADHNQSCYNVGHIFPNRMNLSQNNDAFYLGYYRMLVSKVLIEMKN